MKASLLRKWERYAIKERELRRKALRLHPGSDDAMAARIEVTLAQVALNRVERAIARAAYFEAFGVKPSVALVTKKTGVMISEFSVSLQRFRTESERQGK